MSSTRALPARCTSRRTMGPQWRCKWSGLTRGFASLIEK